MELGNRRARWAVPACAVAIVAALVAGTAAASAQPAAQLPPRTAAQVLADVARAPSPGPYSGTFTETASLGLPALPGGNGPLSGPALLAGTHTFQIWSGGPQQVRIAEPVALGEGDLRQFGNQVWLWNSRTQQATHIVLPAEITPGRQHAGPPAGAHHRAPVTPQQAAQRILAAMGTDTAVSVDRTATVAGQPAYQLTLTPKPAGSLIGRITVAIGARHDLPLRVQVFARGAVSPAFEIGYTSLTFGPQSPSNFTFTPPPGAKVKTIHVPAFAHRHVRQHGVPRQPVMGGPGPGDPGRATADRPRVTGSGWLSVLVVPASVSPAAVAGMLSDGPRLTGWTGSPASPNSAAAASPSPSGAGPGLLRAILKAATPVHGDWGSGRLLRTSLLSVLITSQGTVLIGPVTPAVLYADAAAAS